MPIEIPEFSGDRRLKVTAAQQQAIEVQSAKRLTPKAQSGSAVALLEA